MIVRVDRQIKIFSVNDPRNVHVDLLRHDVRFHPPWLVLRQLFRRRQNRFRFFFAECRERSYKNDEPALKQAFHHGESALISDEYSRLFEAHRVHHVLDFFF